MGGQPRRRAERAAAGCPIGNGAVTSAVLVHLRVEPAHFDWRWRERPVLALLAWEALARDPLVRLRRFQVESIGTTINFRPAVITNRDIAAPAHACGGRRRCRRSRAHGPGMHAATKARPKLVPGPLWKRARALGLANGRQAGFDRFDRSQADLSAEGVD